MLKLQQSPHTPHACHSYVHPSTKLSFVHIRALLLHRSVYPSGKTEAEATLAAQFCEETAAWM